MYKNLKEIAAHKQRLWFKKSYSREIFFLIGYWIVELVFLEWSFLYIKKLIAVLQSLMHTTCMLEEHIQHVYFVCTMYLRGISVSGVLLF